MEPDKRNSKAININYNMWMEMEKLHSLNNILTL